MNTSRIKSKRLIRAVSFGFVITLNFALAGCAYRLSPTVLPSQHRLKVVADSSESYVLRLRIRERRDYQVPADGRVTLDAPAYRAGCSVYLFDKIRIRRGANPFTARTIDIVVGGKITRQLSLKEISTLPADPEGYHLLALRAPR
jgi:hypothetical protein